MRSQKLTHILLVSMLFVYTLPYPSRAQEPIQEQGLFALAPVDYLPPAMTAIDVDGNYAYVGAGPSLLVIDVSDPADPQRVGYELLPGMVLRVMPVQGRVYVTTRDASGDRLMIFDSSQPENLRLIANHDLNALDGTTLTVEGSRIYAAEANSVIILDATDPLHLVKITEFVIPEFTSLGAMHAREKILTLIAKVVGALPPDLEYYLVILDLTDPYHPVEVGKLKLSAGTGISDVYITDKMAAIAGSYSGGGYDYSAVELIDLTDQAHPASINKINVGIGFSPVVALLDQILIAGQRGEPASFYDISDPSAPEQLGALNDPCEDMIAHDGRLYSANGASGMAIYTSPDGHILEEQGSMLGIGSAEDISLEAGKLAIADGGLHLSYGGLAIVEIASTEPNEFAAKLVGAKHVLDTGIHLALRADIVYLLAGMFPERYTSCAQGLYTIDISQAQSPQNLGAYSFPCENFYNFSGPITLHEDYVYLPGAEIDSYRNGMAIFDVSQPATPTLASYYWWPSAENFDPIYSLAITGTYGLISTFHESELSSSYDLRVLDFTNPISPTIIWSYPVGDQVQVLFRDGLSFIAEGGYGSHGLYAFETDQLPEINIVSDLHFSEQVLDVAYDGRYAYIADGEAGLIVYDLIDPGAPRNVHTYDSPGTAKRVILDGEYVYLADGDGGLFVFRKTFLYPQAYIPLILSQVESTAGLAK